MTQQKKILALKQVAEGDRLQSVGQMEEAIRCYDKAIAIDPACAYAYLNRGAAFLVSGRYDLVNPDLQKAFDLDPGNTEIYYKFSLMCMHGRDFLAAIKALQKVLELDPNYQDAGAVLAECYARIGDTPTARKLFKKLVIQFPHNAGVKLDQALLLPAIYASQEEIDRLRMEFMQNIDRLMEEKITITNPIQQPRIFPFYQAYHARNNVALMRKMAELFYHVCPTLRYTAPHCRLPLKPKKKLRLGFMSHHMHKNLNQFWQDLIEGLARRGDFEVYVFSASPRTYDKVREIESRIHKYVPLDTGDNQLEISRERIAAEKLDILVYLEIGMSNLSYFLAMSRLAPVQCMLPGHPVTTGIPTMDYFICTQDVEPEGAQEHYTEALVLCDHNPIVFQRPSIPGERLSRKALGLPGDETHIYCCPVMLFKLHPDMDHLFAAILSRDPKGVILLFDSEFKTLWRHSLEQRFAAAMPPEDAKRIVFIPHADLNSFFQVLACSDAILDCVHFSFGTTSLLTLAAGLPFVTWPGEFMRGRGGYFHYRQMGMQDLIAATHEQYVEIALRLANDKNFHSEMSAKIRASNDILFSDHGFMEEFSVLMKTFYDKAGGSNS